MHSYNVNSLHKHFFFVCLGKHVLFRASSTENIGVFACVFVKKSLSTASIRLFVVERWKMAEASLTHAAAVVLEADGWPWLQLGVFEFVGVCGELMDVNGSVTLPGGKLQLVLANAAGCCCTCLCIFVFRCCCLRASGERIIRCLNRLRFHPTSPCLSASRRSLFTSQSLMRFVCLVLFSTLHFTLHLSISWLVSAAC